MDQANLNATHNDGFPLSSRQQLGNVVLYALTNGLIYLAAPVVYVGILQASLCKALGSTDVLANLPSSAFYCSTIVPILVAWRFHTVQAIKPVIVGCFLISAAGGLLVAALLYWHTPAELRLWAVIAHSGLIGGALFVLGTFQWELISRGIASRWHGLTFGLTFGVGPILAVAGSLIAQLILSGTLEYPGWSPSAGWEIRSLVIGVLPFPTNYALLFAATAPILVFAAVLTTGFVLPRADAEPARSPLISGLSKTIRELLADRILVIALAAYVLVESGFSIQNNMSLYTQVALQQPAEAYAGYQNALRFCFKMVAGLGLGWLLGRTHAKMGMLVTGGSVLCGILWVLLMPHAWFLICFGMMGAGELYGVYYPNYIMKRSRADRVRHNLAVLPLLGLVSSISPAIFGAISDNFSLPVSFVMAAIIVGASLAMIALGLPARPKPPE